MVDTPEALAERLKGEGERVVGFFNQLSQSQWGLILYTQDPGWNMTQLLAHFVASEIGHIELIRDVLSGGGGAPQDFDIDAFNQREVDHLCDVPPVDLIKRFSQLRSQLVEVVSAMKPTDLERTGNDPFLGIVPLVDMIKLTYRHHQIHLRDAKRLLNT
jgi:hypothetical protein